MFHGKQFEREKAPQRVLFCMVLFETTISVVSVSGAILHCLLGRPGVRGLPALPERAPGGFWCLLAGQKARVVRAATAGPTVGSIGTGRIP